MHKLKLLFIAVVLFIIGIFGGFMGATLVPLAVANIPLLKNFEVVTGPDRVTVIREEPKEVIIDKAEAVSRATEKVKSSVVAVERKKGSEIQASLSGIVVTSDGWIITSASLAQNIIPGRDSFFVIVPGEMVPLTLVKIDTLSGLALFAATNRNFYTPDFSSASEIALGDTVFLLSAFEDATLENSLEIGYVAHITSSTIDFSSGFAASSSAGGAVFSDEGKLLGLIIKNTKSSAATFVSSEKIKDFMSSARK